MPGDSRLKPSTQRAFGSRKKRAWNKKAPATSAPSAAELESRPDPLDLPGTSTDDTVGPSSTSETLRVDAAYYSTAEQAQRVERSAQTKTVLSGKSATQRKFDLLGVNHFPGSFHLGRKDKLWQNVVRLGRIRGEKGRPSLPDTFLLPQELPLLRDAWSAETPGDHCWIIKPPASARGAGVHVVHRWDQIPKKQPLVVQRYVRTPYLINGTKFDLRLYALVTSFDPLKIYLFPDGLVRFASIKYSQECEDLSDRYMHLTNYSINKKSATYTAGGSGDCQGHKWSIKALQGYLEGLGVDFASLWEQMVDIVVKTLACAEGPMNRLIQRHTSSRYTCYELFGFDILLDEQLKPWLLEVNISPSLRSATPVDYTVKSEVVKDMLNLAGFQLPQQLKDDLDERLLECYGLEEQDDLSLNPLLHTYSLSPAELLKHRHYETSLMDVEEETSGLLESLTPDDVRVLVQSEDELSRCGSFKRVFPGGRHGDVTLLAHRRYYNLLLAAWERRYGHQRHKGLCALHIPVSLLTTSSG
ncbi:hypothetical protein HPB52_008801 [Rhipicephalus sanguineus]|uniref:Tubulin polyglutamylase TTLL4 n=1 Tax=Rhipicephalus sanguineus TaxID=34632 RepID=A0A9D4PZ03_RHISA|nr:hypothetical protein HPB52_008801 [Rhipicephalus sanguineus]